MKQLFLTVGVVGACGALAYYVFTHPARDRVRQLRQEYKSLRSQNDRLERKNERLRREIVALREDPRLAERRVRQRAGLARPNELIVQFEGDDGSESALQIELRVTPESLRVAGESETFDTLGRRLESLREEFPDAQLNVRVEEGVSILRQERVRDLLDDSPYSNVEVPTSSVATGRGEGP